MLRSTATSNPSRPSGSCAVNKKRVHLRPNSQDSSSSATHTGAPLCVPIASHVRSAGGSAGLSSCSMPGAMRAQSMLQNTSTSMVSGRTCFGDGAQHTCNTCIDDPVTSNSASGDPKSAHKTAFPHTCTALNVDASAATHVQSSPREEGAAANANAIKPRRPSDVGSNASATGHRPSSIHSRNSSHDVTYTVTDAELAEQDGWWKKRNRCVFLGEDVEMLHTVEQALEAVVSVHQTDSLMYHEMMLPAWELTPVCTTLHALSPRNPCCCHPCRSLPPRLGKSRCSGWISCAAEPISQHPAQWLQHSVFLHSAIALHRHHDIVNR